MFLCLSEETDLRRRWSFVWRLNLGTPTRQKKSLNISLLGGVHFNWTIGGGEAVRFRLGRFAAGTRILKSSVPPRDPNFGIKVEPLMHISVRNICFKCESREYDSAHVLGNIARLRRNPWVNSIH
jgi:hypothetical protein